MAASAQLQTDSSSREAERQERKRQLRGLLLLAVVALVFSLLRAGLGRVFTHGWWRLW
ncbi:MAG: hypothetical protein FWD64_03365 [Acidobacteriaceae bacterium]|nr:hypothetical protein [Acidobacteriaceae bacterium]